WANETNDPQGRKNAEFIKEYVDNGILGAKTGKGFYEYPDAAYRRPDFLE
ncbi:MAG: 3-hydroxyacyl-CoA dehydrogenase, partial [Deltaproteobacteria bacterium]|nr:3-hydroxyacyl-CoA dehydrogenase [Deltaproteobacteria bacterium]